jgi:preprotein translocase subunit SecG
MVLNFFNVIYVLVALAMIILILLQRGAGAQAGSGFGSGASATVFGARGAANFLSRSTAILAGVFFLLSIAMGIYLNNAGVSRTSVDDLGVMGTVPDAKPAPATPAAGSDVPQTPPATGSGSDKPATPPAAAPAAGAPASDVPAAPSAAPASDKPAVPAADKNEAAAKSGPAGKKGDKPKGK